MSDDLRGQPKASHIARRCHPSQAGALPFKDKAGWLVAKGRAKATSPQLMALRAYNDVIARAPIATQHEPS